MDDQLDKDLSGRIKEVFDNYNDASADEGWLKLREKFPEEKRRRGLIWLWPAAALLLLFLGVGLVMLFNQRPAVNQLVKSKPAKPNTMSQEAESEKNIAKNAVVSPLVNTDSEKINHQAIKSTGQKNVAGGNPVVTNAAKSAPINKTGLNLNNKRNFAANQAHISQPGNAANTSGGVKSTSQANGLPPGVDENQSSTLIAKADTLGKKGIKLGNADQNFAVIAKPNVSKKDTSVAKSAIKKPTSIDEMFAADEAKNGGDTKVKSDMCVKFGVYAATYINYAKNGNNQVNAGGGFTAAIPIAKNLRLVTGASINQNSFSYNGGGGVAPMMLPAVLTSSYTATNKNFTTGTDATTYSNNASLLGVDVPLNLQYQFNTRKNPVYISGGFSSGTFINESYSNIYSNGSTAEAQSAKGLNDFYFARTLNLGFGIGYPVGKSQIVIEPFVKYPLEGMGAQQLKFGASGINLKFNFDTKK